MVIAVLGVIAAGVLVAINPGKRIRQANDSKIKNDVGQIATALQAYYTSCPADALCTQLYPASIATLVTSEDLKVEPNPPGAGNNYSYAVSTTCNTTDCEAVVYYALEDPGTAGNVWCWRSATGSAAEMDATSCAP